MSDKLKPCPFCGSDNIEMYTKGLNVCVIKCKHCGITRQQKVRNKSLAWLEETMVENWNIRTQKDVTLNYDKLKEIEILVQLSFGQVYPHPELIRIQRLVSEMLYDKPVYKCTKCKDTGIIQTSKVFGDIEVVQAVICDCKFGIKC